MIERHGERFLGRIFTPAERAKAEGRANRVETYAKRFAAKEACAKALGTGFRGGVFWRDMGVVNLPSGRPTMELTGGALDALAGDHAGRLRGADRRFAHRRRPDRAGHRHHFGGAAKTAGVKPGNAIRPSAYQRSRRSSLRAGMAAATRSPGRAASGTRGR